MEHVLIDPGILPLKQLKEIIKDYIHTHKFTFITERRMEVNYIAADLTAGLLFYEDFEIMKDSKLNADYQSKYNIALKTVLDDQRTLLLAERMHIIFQWRSLFSLTTLIENIVFNSLFFFQENKTDSMFFEATPHALTNWVMTKTAESIGITVRLIQKSPIPWRYWIVEGVDIQKPIFPNNVHLTDFDEKLLDKYIQLNQADYLKALPEYERKRLDKNKGKFWSWKKEIQDIFKQPHFLVKLGAKRKLYNLYESLSVESNLNEKYIVFFLHFQPERTSLPEGLEFSNQWFIIRMISQALPKGWKLIVKEHPSIYTNYLDWKYRGTKFYNNIASLRNVELVSLSFNTFDLIDSAQGIVTITGTVATQALIRGKSVLVFGVAAHRSLKNVYTIHSSTDLSKAFNSIQNSEEDKFDQNSFHAINANSISGIEPEDFEDNNFYKQEYNNPAQIKLIDLYLKARKEL